MTLRTLNYGNYGIFLIMGNAGFCPSTVVDVGAVPLLTRGIRRPSRCRNDIGYGLYYYCSWTKSGITHYKEYTIIPIV